MPVTIGGSGPITGVTSINTTVSDTELGYLDGVTSALQTQLAGKADILSNGAWTSYTPTWTNLTVGNATQNSFYTQIGKLVVVRVQLTFGTTTSLTSVIDISLPVTSRSLTGNPNLGVARFIDANGAQHCGVIVYISSTAVRFQRQVVSGSNIIADEVSSTAPFTWTSTDQFHGYFSYEAA